MQNQQQKQVSRLVSARSQMLLKACREAADKRLSACFQLVFDRIDDAFFELANKADTSARQTQYFDAMREVRLKRESLENILAQRLARQFDSALDDSTKDDTAPASSWNGELSLLESCEVELDLAVQNFVEHLEARAGAELRALDCRIGHLLNDPQLQDVSNPFGPRAIGTAFREMCRELEHGIEPQLTMFKLLAKHCSGEIIHLYHELNRQLIAEHILPTITDGHGRVPVHAPGKKTRVIIETEDGSEEHSGEDVFATLQRLAPATQGLSLRQLMAPTHGPGGVGSACDARVPAGAPVGGVGGVETGAQVISTANALTYLTELQHGQLPDGVDAAVLNQQQLSSGGFNTLRVLHDTAAMGRLEPADNLALDIVSILFDYVLNDPSLSARIKNVIGRLQIPLLKVALLDKNLFSKKTHPARRLLDAMANAALRWGERDDLGEDKLYHCLETAVEKIVNEFDDDIEIFAETLATFEAALATEEQNAHLRAQDLTKSLEPREQIALAKFAVDDAVKNIVVDVKTRDFLRCFIYDYWRQVLIITYVEQGVESQAWEARLKVIDELLWSVEPKSTDEERKRLTQILPPLIKEIKAGMKMLEMPRAECAKFLSALASVHVVSVKRATKSTLVERRLSTQPEEQDPVSESRAPTLSEEEFISNALDRLFARKTLDADELDIDLEALNSTEQSPDNDEVTETVMNLNLGDWIDFETSGGDTLRARFTWLSPGTGRYLFTTRSGQKALDLTLPELVEKLRSGKSTIIPGTPDPVFDRAIGDLLDKLDQQQVA